MARDLSLTRLRSWSRAEAEAQLCLYLGDSESPRPDDVNACFSQDMRWSINYEEEDDMWDEVRVMPR